MCVSCRQLGEPQLAEGFLTDAFKVYQRDKWSKLTAYALIDLAQCQKLIPTSQHKYPFLANGTRMSFDIFVVLCRLVAVSSFFQDFTAILFLLTIIMLSDITQGCESSIRCESMVDAVPVVVFKRSLLASFVLSTQLKLSCIYSD